MSRLQIVVGGQFGSEGKGAIAAHLSATRSNLLAVRVGGPNAGHTVLGRCPPTCPDKDTHGLPGEVATHPWRLRHVPVAAVTAPSARLLLAAGSEIDPGVLLSEISALDRAGYDVSSRIKVHPLATIIESHHVTIETDPGGFAPSLVEKIGSTGKGIGAARASRIMRNAALATQHSHLDHLILQPDEPDPQAALRLGTDVLIEGTQGYGLGLHAGYYPFSTSSDCTASDFLAQAGISTWTKGVSLEVWVVFRPYPIRVAGNSGPMRGETTWKALDVPPELTTVTRRVRRVGGWDPSLAASAMIANGQPSPHLRVALTMVDQVIKPLHGLTHLEDSADYMPDLSAFLHLIESDLAQPVNLIGTGPATVCSPQVARKVARSNHTKAVTK